MRLPLLLGLVPLLAACSEGAQRKDFQDLASAPRVSRTEAISLVQPLGGANLVALNGNAVPAAPLAAAPIGHLEGPDRLAHLFQRFASLDEGRGHDDVRILQFGDSHTASDMGATAFRHVLQARFGDGGRGFVSLGCPWKNYVQEGIRGCWMNDEFESQRARPRTPLGFGVNTTNGVDGDFGLLGVSVGASRGGAYASTQIGERFSRFEVAYLQEPLGGSFDVMVDGARAGRVSTRSATGLPASSGFTSFDTTDGPHQIDVRTVGDGSVRVFGVGLDRPQTGVVVTALGINGAQIFTALRSSEEHFEEQVRHQAPALVVLAYGTNEAADPNLDDATYERGLVDILGRVSRAAPNASCLLLGPPDFARWTKGSRGYHTVPRILEIDAIQRRIARAAGCAFYDQIEAMGGPGSMAAWAAEPTPRAQQDRMHLTRAGYTQVGTSFATDVLHAYDEWRAETGLPPTGAEKAWDVARR
ncbi:MAG TPA: GDSL-type esterase/lipase family protein [Polyangiaceae bacterium]|nr:GDSL-type esterase/lipase family protein [Polyangiaceae bacterium]